MINWLEWFRRRQSAKCPWHEWEYLVLDLETSGLDPKEHQIISIGWVLIQNGAIQLSSAKHYLLENAPINDSVGIHHITDHEVEEFGRNETALLRYLRQLMKKRVLVIHHAPMDFGFLKPWWARLSAPVLSCYWLDTLAIERTRVSRRQQIVSDDGFRLMACRERYGLPEYQGHDALTDALATAELLLAQQSYQGLNGRLSDLLALGGGIVTFPS